MTTDWFTYEKLEFKLRPIISFEFNRYKHLNYKLIFLYKGLQLFKLKSELNMN